ncbi:hypothetical protein DSO57_1033459 [Entomophthora muscae]|uniref:Uncharacterized protein n=1 Tax=Entomophthora muscae TaxID=34485 RepID=A0ACC2TYR0_9FUNG|nr:hypothetical protein DSO57_1033459 [Entomophthora muscae]
MPESPASKKQGDYTHLDQSTCEHDGSMVMNYDSLSSYQKTQRDPAHQSDCKVEETVYENSSMDISYASSPKELISNPIIDNDYLNTPIDISILGSPEIFINMPMDEFNTPMECRIAIDEITKTKTEGINVIDNVNTHTVPGIKVNNLESQQPGNRLLDIQGISMDQLFEQTKVTIYLADLLCESPKLRQKAHRTVTLLIPMKKEESYLAGTGAPRTEAAVNNCMTHVILDGGSYSNLITAKFLESLPNVRITSSDLIFLMADGSEKYSLGKAVGLKLWIGGAEISIDTAIFDCHKYTLLLGRQTMTQLGIKTQYIGNKWTIEHNNQKVQLHVTFDSPQITKLLCKPIKTNINKKE